MIEKGLGNIYNDHDIPEELKQKPSYFKQFYNIITYIPYYIYSHFINCCKRKKD